MIRNANRSKLQKLLTSTLKRLLQPEEVKGVRITWAREGRVVGFLLTHCPVEGRDSGKDFEARLSNANGSVKDVVVDGRRFVPGAVAKKVRQKRRGRSQRRWRSSSKL